MSSRAQRGTSRTKSRVIREVLRFAQNDNAIYEMAFAIRGAAIASAGCFLFVGNVGARELNPAALHAAAAYSANHRGASLLVIQNGRTLFEQYPRGGSAETPRRIYSGTKAFWNLAALAAAQDGLLNFDEPVAETIAQWRNDSRKARVTIRQLLDFSCGLAPAFSLHNNNAKDRDAAAMKLPLVANPGGAFIYGPSALQIFYEVLKKKLGDQSPTRYLERRVLCRLGLGPQRYLFDRAGNPLLASGWELTARDWAKLGKLVLKGGAPVISRASLEQCWRGSEANRAFSLGWWNNRAAPNGNEFDFENMLDVKWPRQNWSHACLCRDAPNDLVACIGSGRQRLYVIPSMEVVVVRHGAGGSFSDAAFLRLLLRE
jgi:CubicO group peptidase (beta-lactamase class C family)